MVSLELPPRRILGYVNGKHIAKLDMQVSTVEELPTLNSAIEDYYIAAGSIAQIIQNGKWYTLDANGQWYFSGGVAPEEGD